MRRVLALAAENLEAIDPSDSNEGGREDKREGGWEGGISPSSLSPSNAEMAREETCRLLLLR
jgi:hypothetical protein